MSFKGSSDIKQFNSQFLEDNCTIEIDGKSFTSGGSFIGKHRKTGLLGGCLYAYPKENKIGSWNGEIKIPCKFKNQWLSNMGDTRQLIYFEYKGHKFWGIYYKSSGDLVRIKEVKK